MNRSIKRHWVTAALAILVLILLVLHVNRPDAPCVKKHKTRKYRQFDEALNRSNNIQVDKERGWWSGSDSARYHDSHYGHGVAGRVAVFFASVGAKSVVDLGGGGGQHARFLIARGFHVSCYDGNPDTQFVSNGTCAVLDLTRQIRIAPHEWALSLSVGRQIPPEHEAAFISNVDRVNTRGVVMYWGDDKPTDDTRKTVRSNAQVLLNFERLGYAWDEAASEALMGGRKAVEDHRGYSILALYKAAPQPPEPEVIRIAVVSCNGSKLQETVTMVKAAIIFTQHTKLVVYAFSDEVTMQRLAEGLQDLEEEARGAGFGHFSYELHETSWPPEIEGAVPWRQVFKPCSLQRLFLPDVLPEVDSVLYLDADTLPLTNLSSLWSYFGTMNSTQFVAMSPITEPLSNSSWFTQRGLPHYGATGLNCGMALMNLTRMREARFVEKITALRAKYEPIRPPESGDQFLQNIFYSKHPEHVLLLPCHWNLRPLHCNTNCFPQMACACRSAIEGGVALLHGTKDAFTDPDRLPLFKAVHQVVQETKLAKWEEMADSLVNAFESVENSSTCFINSSAAFYGKFTSYMQNLTSENHL